MAGRRQDPEQQWYDAMLELAGSTQDDATLDTLDEYFGESHEDAVKFRGYPLQVWAWLMWLRDNLPRDTMCTFELPGTNLLEAYLEDRFPHVHPPPWGFPHIVVHPEFEYQLAQCREYHPETRFVIGVLELKGHANGVIFDFDHRTVSRFEPLGAEFTWYDQGALDAAFERDVINATSLITGWNYIRPVDSCPGTGPQMMGQMSQISVSGEIAGYCAAWSALLMHFRIMNPHVSEATAMAHFTAMPRQDLALLIRRYAAYIVSRIESAASPLEALSAGTAVRYYTKSPAAVYFGVIASRLDSAYDIEFSPSIIARGGSTYEATAPRLFTQRQVVEIEDPELATVVQQSIVLNPVLPAGTAVQFGPGRLGVIARFNGETGLYTVRSGPVFDPHATSDHEVDALRRDVVPVVPELARRILSHIDMNRPLVRTVVDTVTRDTSQLITDAVYESARLASDRPMAFLLKEFYDIDLADLERAALGNDERRLEYYATDQVIVEVRAIPRGGVLYDFIHRDGHVQFIGLMEGNASLTTFQGYNVDATSQLGVGRTTRLDPKSSFTLKNLGGEAVKLWWVHERF